MTIVSMNDVRVLVPCSFVVDLLLVVCKNNHEHTRKGKRHEIARVASQYIIARTIDI